MLSEQRRKVEAIALATSSSVGDIMNHLRLPERERAAVKSIVDGAKAKRK